MNTRIGFSILSILAAAGLMAGATFAFFSDAGTSTGNNFATGSFDLRLSDNNETSEDIIDTTFNSSTMAPGTNPVTATIQLRNVGSVVGDNFHLKAENTVTDAGDPENSQAMDRFLEITAATYDAGNILPSIPDTNGNGWKDLDDLESVSDGPELGDLNDLNIDHPLVMTVQLRSEANNTYQGDSVATVFTATLHQDASQ